MRFTAYAFLSLTFGTASFFDRKSFFYNNYVFFLFTAYKLKRGEDSGRSGADNYQIAVNFIQDTHAPF